MKHIRFWIPVVIGVVLTPICFYLIGVSAAGPDASGHAGAGLGAMLLLYPLPTLFMMLSSGGTAQDAFFSQLILRLAFAAMLLQLPLYGFIISYSKLRRSSWLRFCAGVIWLHLIAALAGLTVLAIQRVL